MHRAALIRESVPACAYQVAQGRPSCRDAANACELEHDRGSVQSQDLCAQLPHNRDGMIASLAEAVGIDRDVHVRVLVQELQEPREAIKAESATARATCNSRIAICCLLREQHHEVPEEPEQRDKEGAIGEGAQVVKQSHPEALDRCATRHTVSFLEGSSSAAPGTCTEPKLHCVGDHKLRHCAEDFDQPDGHERIVRYEPVLLRFVLEGELVTADGRVLFHFLNAREQVDEADPRADDEDYFEEQVDEGLE
mmetsp:Transcript_449/g.1120  ORF Transcript_449/g.1120 Transcript_449/m.1120 type:complete len:252 (-) Transcript_449:634-1389(-)